MTDSELLREYTRLLDAAFMPLVWRLEDNRKLEAFADQHRGRLLLLFRSGKAKWARPDKGYDEDGPTYDAFDAHDGGSDD